MDANVRYIINIVNTEPYEIFKTIVNLKQAVER